MGKVNITFCSILKVNLRQNQKPRQVFSLSFIWWYNWPFAPPYSLICIWQRLIAGCVGATWARGKCRFLCELPHFDGSNLSIAFVTDCNKWNINSECGGGTECLQSTSRDGGTAWGTCGKHVLSEAPNSELLVFIFTCAGDWTQGLDEPRQML